MLGVGLLYSTWRAVDLALPLLLFVYFHLSVVWVEEPALRRQFGSEYRRVPASESRGGFLFQCHAHGLPNRTMQLTSLHAAGDRQIRLVSINAAVLTIRGPGPEGRLGYRCFGSLVTIERPMRATRRDNGVTPAASSAVSTDT